MNNPLEDFVRQVQEFVRSFGETLTSDEYKEVEHLIDHDECPEALRTLAWIIVENNKRVPFEKIRTIQQWTKDWFEDGDMPKDLEKYAL